MAVNTEFKLIIQVNDVIEVLVKEKRYASVTTILGWDYYSERCLAYLTNNNMAVQKVFKWLYVLAVFAGPFLTVSAVWTIAEIFNGFMAIPNLIALIALSGVVAAETKSFFERVKDDPKLIQ